MPSLSAPGESVSYVTQHLVFCRQLRSKVVCVHENEPGSFYFCISQWTLSRLVGVLLKTVSGLQVSACDEGGVKAKDSNFKQCGWKTTLRISNHTGRNTLWESLTLRRSCRSLGSAESMTRRSMATKQGVLGDSWTSKPPLQFQGICVCV